jgi:hypothetical protein
MAEKLQNESDSVSGASTIGDHPDVEKPTSPASRLAKPWQKGQSGNPRGRTPTPPELRRKALNAAPNAIQVAIDVVDDVLASRQSGRKTKHSPGHIQWAVNTVLDRSIGRPEQAIAIASADTQSIAESAARETLRELLVRQLAQLESAKADDSAIPADVVLIADKED